MESKYYGYCTECKVKELPRGEFFLTSLNSRRVYIRDEYDRTERMYYGQSWDDISMGRLFKGDRIVYVGFTF